MKFLNKKTRAPLIDRLTDLEPGVQSEPRPLRAFTAEELKASVARDLSWLLNTRVSNPADRYDEKELTVIDYGMPDLNNYAPASAADRKMLIRRLTRAISAFEPRLQNIQVSVKPVESDLRRLEAVIDAMLIAETVREPVSFLTIFQAKPGKWEISENHDF